MFNLRTVTYFCHNFLWNGIETATIFKIFVSPEKLITWQGRCFVNRASDLRVSSQIVVLELQNRVILMTSLLKAHRQISEERRFKFLNSIVHVIKHANFQLYWAHPNGVIWKSWVCLFIHDAFKMCREEKNIKT